jgi:hypothetical protein
VLREVCGVDAFGGRKSRIGLAGLFHAAPRLSNDSSLATPRKVIRAGSNFGRFRNLAKEELRAVVER